MFGDQLLDLCHIHHSQINFLSEKLTEAKEDFEKCISLNDRFIPAKIQLAYCIYKSAALQQSPILAQGAVEMLQRTVEKYPDSADAHSLYAQVNIRVTLVKLIRLYLNGVQESSSKDVILQ